MYMQEDQVTTQDIIKIFSGAFMDVTDIGENIFSVKGLTLTIPLRVILDKDHKSIRFADYSRLHRISEEDAAFICNEVNKTIRLGRTYATTLNDGAVLVACEYDMTYEKGLIPFQVMANFRLFDKIADHVIRNNFVDYLQP